MIDLLAQVQLHNRSGGGASCVADNGFCPGWIVETSRTATSTRSSSTST